jgi:hypothetical protein
MPGLVIVAIDIGQGVMGDPFMKGPARSWYWVCGASFAWLIGCQIVVWVLRASGDRCLDVLGWLFPKMIVYEVRGVHYQILGWVTHLPSPELRLVILAQSCYLGTRILRLDLPPKYSDPFEGEPIRPEVKLEGGRAVMALVRRKIREWPDKVLFDVKVSVDVESSGARIRRRRGWAPETTTKQMAEFFTVVHSPIHLAIWALNNAPQKEAPLVLHRITQLEKMEWPSEEVQPVWVPNSGWQLKGTAHSLMSRISEAYGQVADSSGALKLPLR